MPSQAPAGVGTRTRGDVRERILAAANELFYSHGIRATSADKIIERVGITKVTFYRHFGTKGDLVVAYLERQGGAERAWFESIRTAGDPAASLAAVADGIGDLSCMPGFRGCAFINAAAEFGDADDAVRAVVDVHRAWMLGYFEDIAREAGVADAAQAARQLMMLRDGAMVAGYLGAPAALPAWLGQAFAAVIAAP